MEDGRARRLGSTANASLGHRGQDRLQGGGEIWVGSCKGFEWGVEIFQ